MFYNEKIFKRCFWHRRRYWYRNIKNIPLYFRLIHHLVKYGYDEYATWMTFSWFIDTLKPILIKYHNHHDGYPPCTAFGYNEEEQEQFNIKYDADIDRMIELFDDMDEDNPKYRGNYESYKEMCAAKDEFFELFSKYFYCLWN